jgi:hypothetical protein
MCKRVHTFFRKLILSFEMNRGAQAPIEERVFWVAGKYLLMGVKYTAYLVAGEVCREFLEPTTWLISSSPWSNMLTDEAEQSNKKREKDVDGMIDWRNLSLSFYKGH